MENIVITPIVHEVDEITEEVYEDAEEEALETGQIVIVTVVEKPNEESSEE